MMGLNCDPLLFFSPVTEAAPPGAPRNPAQAEPGQGVKAGIAVILPAGLQLESRAFNRFFMV